MLALACGGGVPPNPAGDRDHLEIREGIEPGHYEAEAWVNPGSAGDVEVRAFVVGTVGEHALPEETGPVGSQLSADSIARRSRRTIGHGPDPDVRFHYLSDFMIYEGDWEPYRVRFELWHLGAGGERLLVQTEQEIVGWGGR